MVRERIAAVILTEGTGTASPLDMETNVSFLVRLTGGLLGTGPFSVLVDKLRIRRHSPPLSFEAWEQPPAGELATEAGQPTGSGLRAIAGYVA